MAQQTIDQIHAMCGVVAGTSATPHFAFNTGFNAALSSRIGAGAYKLYFDDPIATHAAVNLMGMVSPSLGAVPTIDVSTGSDASGSFVEIVTFEETLDTMSFTIVTIRPPYSQAGI